MKGCCLPVIDRKSFAAAGRVGGEAAGTGGQSEVKRASLTERARGMDYSRSEYITQGNKKRERRGVK